ncbi:hypothetical protein BGX30_009768 [Mortierella sp. GBA39]|nr:hypothetical protein BGX30_009768 [Mortierella sp. GBA39]
MATPEPEHYAFIDLLFERLLFEQVLLRNQTTGCCISPGALSMQLDLIGHYYTAIATTTFQRLCGEAIHNRDFSNFGILSYLNNHQRQQQQPFKIFPNSLAGKFDLGIESDRPSKLRDHIFCPWISQKQIKDFKRDYGNKVSKEHQKELEFLVDMLDQNGLLRVPNCDMEPEFLNQKSEQIPVDEILVRHVDNLKATHICTYTRVLQEASLLNNIKSITSFEPVLLSSSANGINISDYDVEIVLVAPETTGSSMDLASSTKSNDQTNGSTSTTTPAGKKLASKPSLVKAGEDGATTLTMKTLTTLLAKAGYKSIQQLDRYFDPSSEINITLDHPLGICVRDLLQDYAHIDTRVEPFIFVVQQTLDDFGRCRQYLSNYSLALMTIAFLQTKKILPLLQRHLVQLSSPASSTQSTTCVASVKPSQVSPSIACTSTSSSFCRQPNDKHQSDLPESEKTSQPQKRQQEHCPAVSKAQIKSRKRKDKKRIHREKTLLAANILTLAQTRPFDNKTTRETVAELLVDFMDHFGFSHGSTECEISIILGSTTSPAGSTVSASGSQSSQDRVSKNTPPCLVVRDPFVTDRNVTWRCSQWRLSHCERMFMRTHMFLEGLGVESDDGFDCDSDEDDDDDEFGLRGYNDSDGINEDEIMEELFAVYAGDYGEEDVEDLSDKKTYPIVPVDEMIHRWRGRAITRLGLNTASGVISYISNNRTRFKILPERLTEKLVLGDEAFTEVCQFIHCTYVFQGTDLAEIRRGFVTLVPEPYREEIEFLMGMLERNGLLVSSHQAVVLTSNEYLVDLRQSKIHHDATDDYTQKLQAERPPDSIRQRKQQQLVDAVQEATSMDAIILSSWAQGIQISDYDLELLLVERPPDSSVTTTSASNEKGQEQSTSHRSTDEELVERLMRMTIGKQPPSGQERVRDIHALATTIKNAGFRSVVAVKRYVDVSCNLNPHYVCFYDPRTQLTCQVTLYSPSDLSTRSLLQAYAEIDTRVEPFVFAVQRTLDNHGRSHEALGNFAVAMIAIHFLQTKGILPKLLHQQGRRVDFGFFTGKADNALPKNPSQDSAGYAADRNPATTSSAQAKPKANTRVRHGRKKQQPPQSIRTASSVGGSTAAGGTTLRGTASGQTATSSGARAISCAYDTELVKVRPFDKSVSRKSVTDLVVSFFTYTAEKFQDWEDRLVPGDLVPDYMFVGAIDHEGKQCSMFMPGTAVICLPQKFSGLVVQDPFVLDRNLAWLCTGWRFMNTSKAFQRAQATVSCGHTGADIRQELIEALLEQAEIEEELQYEFETGQPGYASSLRIIDAWDDFGDSVTSPRQLRDVAEKMIVGSIQDPHF